MDITNDFFRICAVHLYRYGVCFAMASNEIDAFANELSSRQIMHVPLRITREIQFSRRKKDTLKGKKSLGLDLWDSNSETFQRILNCDVDRSTKPAVAVLVMLLPIN